MRRETTLKCHNLYVYPFGCKAAHDALRDNLVRGAGEWRVLHEAEQGIQPGEARRNGCRSALRGIPRHNRPLSARVLQV